MKIQFGTALVLVATAFFFFRGPGHGWVSETLQEILVVITGMTGYAIVLLGAIAAPPKQRRTAWVIAGLLLLPTFGLCAVGAHLMSLGWFGIVLVFVVASFIYLVGSWIQRRNR